MALERNFMAGMYTSEKLLKRLNTKPTIHQQHHTHKVQHENKSHSLANSPQLFLNGLSVSGINNTYWFFIIVLILNELNLKKLKEVYVIK